MFNKFIIPKKYLKLGSYILLLGVALLIAIKFINNFSVIILNIKTSISNFFNVFAPIFFGFVLAYILFRPTIYIQKHLNKLFEKFSKSDKRLNGIHTMTRIFSILILFVIIGASIALIINFVIPPIIDNLKILLDNLPKYQEQFALWIEDLFVSLRENNAHVPSGEEISLFFTNIMENITTTALSLITGLFGKLASFIVDLILTLIFTFYFLKDKESLFKNFKRMRDVLLPPKVAKAVTTFINDLDEIVGKFLIGQIISTIIVGIVSTILMLLIKHPFAVLIGTVAGISNIIPLIGPVIGAIFALALGAFSSLSVGIWGAVLLILYQQVDGNFVQPKIVGDRIGLSAIWILIVVLIGGSYFGAIGMVLSMPFAGLVKIYFNRYAEYKKTKITIE